MDPTPRRFAITLSTRGKTVLPSPEGLSIDPTPYGRPGEKLEPDSLPKWVALEAILGNHPVIVNVIGPEGDVQIAM